jgi:hypothetical protein
MADVKETVASHISTNWTGTVVGGSGSIPTIDEVGPDDITKPEDYPEAVLVYNSRATWDRIYDQGNYGDRHTRVYILVTAHKKTGCTKTHFLNFKNELRDTLSSAITGYDTQVLNEEEDVTRSKGVQGGMYQQSFVLHLYEYGKSTSAASGGGSSGSGWTDAAYVTYQADANLTAEKVLSMSANNTLSATLTTFALAAAADSTYDIGENATRYKKAYLDDLDSTSATIGSLTISGSVTGLEDADVPDNILATEHFQITNRSHTSLTDIGSNTHAQIDTAITNSANHIADTSDPHSTIPDTIANVLTDHDKAAHDALSLSHDSLSDVSTSDHHVKYTDAEAATQADNQIAAATLDDLSDTSITGTLLEDALGYGSGNAFWVPCAYVTEAATGKLWNSGAGYLRNNNGTDTGLSFQITLPLSLGSLALYICGVRIVLSDADANDYVDRIRIFAQDASGVGATLYDDGTNLTSAAVWEDGGGTLGAYGAADDVSGYYNIIVFVSVVTTTAYDLDIESVQLECYYA